jgi:hypothetical protein
MDEERLLDRAALQDLKAAFLRCLDTKDWAGWRRLLTDDMAFYVEPQVGASMVTVAASADEFVEKVSESLQNSVTVHQAHTPELAFMDKNNAAGIWAMSDLIFPSSSGGNGVQGYGHYHEKYVKEADGKWRIKEVRLTRLRVIQTVYGADQPKPSPWKRSATNPE